MGEIKLENLDLSQSEESRVDPMLSVVAHFEHHNKLKLRPPNKVQSWLIELIASAFSFVIVFCVLSVVGILVKTPDKSKKK